MNDSPFRNIPFDAPPPGTFEAIFHALEVSSRDLIGPMRQRVLAIPIRDDAGVVAGGFWGFTLFGWLHVQLLFIPAALRGRGIGSTVMTLAETEARDRGCIGAHVTSFSFQAAPFYEKRGYTPFGQLTDYPPGHSLLYLGKRFEAAAPDSFPAASQTEGLRRARAFAARGDDEAAKQAYVDMLRRDPTDFSALNEIGALARVSGHRSAARTAYAQSVRCHPGNPIGRVNLADVLFEDGDLAGARSQYQAALTAAPDFPEAHQGLARVLTELGDSAAESHRRSGFIGHAMVTRPCRGPDKGVPLLLLVSARGGNIPTRRWIDDRYFAITAIHTEFHDLTKTLPPHALVVNAIGDADLCGAALTAAETLLLGSAAPLINPPARVRATERAANARRLAGVPGAVTATITALSRAAALTADGMHFPLLLRAPGFHGGRHFRYVEGRDALGEAIGALPGDRLLVIEYLDARGSDGMARKYRVMCIDGVLCPVHLAIAADWKVHYFTAAMAACAAHREEERRFLDDMPAVLGPVAMTTLAAIAETLGLDYAGIDFALTRDGAVLVFEANATMVINPPGPEPIWDYRRRATADALHAARNLLLRCAKTTPGSREPGIDRDGITGGSR